MLKIIADDKIPFLPGVFETCADIQYLAGKATTPEIVKDADALITRTRTKCNASLLDESNVKFIATATIGYDHIDTDYCNSHKIKWTNAPGCNSSSVAQYICSTLLNLAVDLDFSLNNKTLGIIGVGNVGKKVAKVANALGMTVLLNDPPRARQEGPEPFTDLDDLLKSADIITLHVPLYKEGIDKTWHLANDDFFAKMKDNAIIINSSRGEVCATEAIKTAITSKKLAAAVLDVWENEPNINLELLKLLNYATPHIAGYSLDGKVNGTSMSVQAISKFFNLDLNDWYPENIPEPDNCNIQQTVSEEDSFEQVMLKIISESYDISNDTKHLKESPETFEKQRGDYPLRREFPVFNVELSGPNTLLIKKLTNSLNLLGFNLQ